MGTMKEKITLKQHSAAYRVIYLENRIEPAVGSVLTSNHVEDLLTEARIHKNLTIKIT